MARRKDHTREEIKDMAVKAGQELLFESGLLGFSARKIATKIGYTVGTIYNVFENHYDIIMNVNASTLDDMHILFSERTSGLRGKELIIGLAKCYIEFAHKDSSRWSLLLEFNIPHDVVRPEWYLEKISNLFVLLEKALIDFKGYDKKVAHHKARMIWASIHGMCTLSLTKKIDVVGAKNITDLADEFIDRILPN